MKLLTSSLSLIILLFFSSCQGYDIPKYYSLTNQAEPEKGKFEVYATMQCKHPLLDENLQNKIWIPNLSPAQIEAANAKRSEWQASSLDQIAKKAAFQAKNSLPFVFTSVQSSIINLNKELDEADALMNYEVFTSSFRSYE